MALTRLQLLALWEALVDSNVRKATLLSLYQAAPQGVKDAIITAMKADINAVLNRSKAGFTDGAASVDATLADVNGVV